MGIHSIDEELAVCDAARRFVKATQELKRAGVPFDKYAFPAALQESNDAYAELEKAIQVLDSGERVG